MANTPNTPAEATRIASADGGEETQPGKSRRSRLCDFMAAEHARLDALLVSAAAGSGADRVTAYQDFRKGLLRHIGIEEKILFPAAQQRRNGEPLLLAGRLKVDHGALAALVMLPPSASTFRALQAVLNAHNPLEDAPGGVYDQCESLAQEQVDELLDRCVKAAEVPVSPWVENPKVVAAAKRVLARAGHDPAVLDE